MNSYLDEVVLDKTYKMKILNSYHLQHPAHLSFLRQLISSPSLPRSILKQIQANLDVSTNHAWEQFFQKECHVNLNIKL